MPFKTLFFGSIVLAISSLWFINWRVYFARYWIASDNRSSKVSWFFLFLYIISRSIILQIREHAQLVHEGLSLQNQFQAIVIILAFCWSFYLVLWNRIKISQALTGARFWITIIIIIYLVSALWSVWPVFTIYRCLELLALWIIVIHIFSKPSTYDLFGKFLIWTNLIILIGTIIANIREPLYFVDIREYLHIKNWFGIFRSNTGGAISAVLIVYLLNQSFILKKKTYKVVWLLAIFSFLSFGSLASVISLFVSLPILFLKRMKKLLRGATLLIIFGAMVLVFIISPKLTCVDNWIDPVASFFKKQPHHIINLSGRIPLWGALWSETKNQPWGFGFAAAERLFTVIIINPTEIGWEATQTHSGYWSAWIGAGWLGLISLIFFIITLWLQKQQLSYHVRPFFLCTLVLLIINNWTIYGIGGFMNPIWIVIMVLSCFPPQKQTYEYYYRSQLLSTARW
jgi:hypothetical protein